MGREQDKVVITLILSIRILSTVPNGLMYENFANLLQLKISFKRHVVKTIWYMIIKCIHPFITQFGSMSEYGLSDF